MLNCAIQKLLNVEDIKSGMETCHFFHSYLKRKKDKLLICFYPGLINSFHNFPVPG